MVGHEDSGTTLGAGALALQSLDLVGAGIDLVVLEDSQLDLLVSVLNLLGLGVGLLLALLGTAIQAQVGEHWGFLDQTALCKDLLNGEGTSSEDQVLLVHGQAALRLNSALPFEKAHTLHALQFLMLTDLC